MRNIDTIYIIIERHQIPSTEGQAQGYLFYDKNDTLFEFPLKTTSDIFRDLNGKGFFVNKDDEDLLRNILNLDVHNYVQIVEKCFPTLTYVKKPFHTIEVVSNHPFFFDSVEAQDYLENNYFPDDSAYLKTIQVSDLDRIYREYKAIDWDHTQFAYHDPLINDIEKLLHHTVIVTDKETGKYLYHTDIQTMSDDEAIYYNVHSDGLYLYESDTDKGQFIGENYQQALQCLASITHYFERDNETIII